MNTVKLDKKTAVKQVQLRSCSQGSSNDLFTLKKTGRTGRCRSKQKTPTNKYGVVGSVDKSNGCKAGTEQE